MTSTRLPGKVLRVAGGRTLLEWHVERLKRCRAIDEVVVATTTNQSDDPIVEAARKLSVGCHRGSEDDVLDRFLGAARAAKAQVVVRVTSDCALWDPAVGAKVIECLTRGQPADIASNVIERTYPRGLDTEVFWMDVLERLNRLAPPPPCPQREHVTFMAYRQHDSLFLKKSVKDSTGNSDLRWCVDTPEDMKVIEAIIAGLKDPFAAYPEILAFARSHPEISAINAEVRQKTE
ncbi:MAG: glycosyltransferase family protein [Planctomycetes bacterium]|nr:glycosyltransferase family protein [Planctomycetota bacterium]